MTQRDRFLLTLIVPALVLGGVWFLLLSPQRKEAEKLDTELATQQQRLASAQSDLIRYQEARKELARAMRDLASAGKAVPADTAVPDLLRQLERTATRSDVRMDAITTATGDVPVPAPVADPAAAEDPAAAPTVTSVDLTLTFKGRFFALERFFGRLDRFVAASRKRVEATGRLVTVSALGLSSDEGRLTAQVQASVFILPTLPSLLPAEPGADPAAPPPGTDPAQPAPSLATATPVSP